MRQFPDSSGLLFTATQAESAERFAGLTSAYLGFRPEIGAILKDLLAAEPDMPMAICAKGYFAKLIGNASQSRRAQDISRQLNEKLAAGTATERERQHAAALAAWAAQQLDQATAIWERILLEHPRDGMALRLAHFAHFYSGDGRRMRDSTARVLPLWTDEHPDYGFLLGMHAFGLEEAGDYVDAEDFGRRAVERNPEDAWSVHSVAHVMEMTGRHQEGIAWISGLQPSWSSVNNFRFHLYWHQCLYHLERGEFDEVIRLYDDEVVSDIESDFYLDICNASALLWRLEMFGLEVGDRWQRLAEVSKRHLEDKELIFVSLHYLMALIANGDDAAVEEMMDNIRAWSTLDTTQGKVCAEVGLALAEGLRHARRGAHQEALDRIEQVRYRMDLIGGSKAQRDVFQMILIDAARASEDALKTRALFAERVGQKAQSAWSWQGYSQALMALGQRTEAEQAAAAAEEIRVVR